MPPLSSLSSFRSHLDAYFTAHAVPFLDNEAKKHDFVTWDEQHQHDDALVYAPTLPTIDAAGFEVVCKKIATAASFAAANGLKVRPIGRDRTVPDNGSEPARDPLHNWSPIHLAAKGGKKKVSDEDRKKYFYISYERLRGFLELDQTNRSVTVLAGTAIAELVRMLTGPNNSKTRGLWLGTPPSPAKRWTLPVLPAPGILSVGGCLAVGAHGTGIRGLPGGRDVGSISATVRGLRTLRWNATKNAFDVVDIAEGDPELPAMSANLGRIPVLSVTLDIVPDRAQRVTFHRVKREKLYGTNANEPKSFARLALDHYPSGVETITFRPADDDEISLVAKNSRKYTFFLTWETDPSRAIPNFEKGGITRHEKFTRVGDGGIWASKALGTRWIFARVSYRRSMRYINEQAKWKKIPWYPSGKARNYVSSDTLKVWPLSYAVVVPRGDVQKVVHGFYEAAHDLVKPTDGENEKHYVAMEARVTPLDPDVPGRARPLLSSTSLPDGVSSDDANDYAVVWVSMLSETNKASLAEAKKYFRKIEERMVALAGSQPHRWWLRPEWSKGWAYGSNGAWSMAQTPMRAFLAKGFPAAGNSNKLAQAKAVYDQLDPHGTFRGPFHAQLGL